MSELSEFLDRLFADGEVVFQAQPVRSAAPDAAARALLQSVHGEVARDIAGPALPFRPNVALTAAEFLRQACWFLVSRGEEPAVVQKELALPPPGDAADHLSGDVVLRYLPHVERKARALDPADPLPLRLGDVLRQWPLSGVLGDAAGPPAHTDFDGHAGLLMLYAERFARAEKPGWLPAGKGREFVALVYGDLGKRPPFGDTSEESSDHDSTEFDR